MKVKKEFNKMKREVLLFTVLITNIAFGSVLPIEVREISEINKNKFNTLTSAVSKHLYERGLDENIAQEKVLKSLIGDEYTNNLMSHNIIENLHEIQREDIISFVSDSALYGHSVDLSSYENIISLVQKSNKLSLNRVSLEKIKNISLENKKIQSFYKLLQNIS